MDEIRKYAWDHNISLFSNRLFVESDPLKSALLRDTLLRELDRYGLVSEQLDKVDGLISQLKTRVGRQETIVAEKGPVDSDLASSNQLLGLLKTSLEIFTQYRNLLLRASEQGAL